MIEHCVDILGRLGAQQPAHWPEDTAAGYNRQDFVMVRPRGADPATFHADPDNVWYCQAILAFSMVVQADEGRYLMKCVLVSKLEEIDKSEDPVAGLYTL